MKWHEMIDAQLATIKTIKTVDEILALCPHQPGMSSGDGFWEGDYDEFMGALFDAGWHTVEIREPYWWAMSEPEGPGIITYCEGDLYRGNKL